MLLSLVFLIQGNDWCLSLEKNSVLVMFIVPNVEWSNICITVIALLHLIDFVVLETKVRSDLLDHLGLACGDLPGGQGLILVQGHERVMDSLEGKVTG